MFLNIIVFTFVIATFFSKPAVADNDTTLLQTKPYIVILGPTDLMQVRINLENYKPTTKEVKKYEVNFGDGAVVLNQTDIYHTYAANQKYVITVKTWDAKNTLTSYIENIEINSTFAVKNSLNSKVLASTNLTDEKNIDLNLTEAQSLKLYKLSFTKNSTAINSSEDSSSRKKCLSELNVSINNIPIFKTNELSCSTTLIEKFVRLNRSNKIYFKSTSEILKNVYKIELNAIDLVDQTPPVLTSNILSNSIVKNNLVHISVNEASLTTTYVWDNNQNLLNTITTKEFDLPLTQGRNDFVLQSIDSSQNKSNYLYLTNIIFDNVPPVLSTTLLTQYIYNSYPQTVSLIVNSNESLQQVTVNNQNAIMVSPTSFQFDILINGPQTLNLNIKSFDLAGNETILTLNPIFDIDNIPPNISVPLASNIFTNNSSFSVSVTDNSTFSTEVFNNGVLVLTSSLSPLVIPLNLGVNNFLIKSTDKYNNVSSVVLNNMTYDNAPPIISANNPVDFYFNSLPQNISLNFSASEPLQSFSVNGQVISESTALQYNYNFSTSTAGSNLITLKAIDLAGNISEKNISLNINLDVTAPVVTMGALPGVTNLSEILLNISVSDLAPTNTSVLLNGQLLILSKEKNFSILATNLIEGQNLIQIVSTDAAGNISQTLNNTIRRDTLPTQITAMSPFLDQPIFTNILPITVPFEFDFNEGISSAVINGNLILPTGLNHVSVPISISSAGYFEIHLDVTDLNGNITQLIKPIFIKFSDQLPILTFSPNIENILTDQISVPITGSSSQILKSLTVNGLPIPIDFSGNNFSGFFNAPQDGLHQLEIIATDIFGNISTVKTQVHVIVSLPQALLNYVPSLFKTPSGTYQIDWGPLFNGPDKASICGALDQIFDGIPKAKSALADLDRIKADINKYKNYVPDAVTRNIPDTTAVKNFIGDVEEPLNQIKGGYLSICKNMDILPALDCPGDRVLFKMIMGQFPEPMIIRKMTFIPISIQDVLIPRTNLCTGFDDSGLSCDEMIKLTPLIGEIFSPAVAEVMSSPVAQGVIDILLCKDLCEAPLVKEYPLLCKDINIPGFPRIKKMPTRFNFGGTGGGVSMDWGGSSDCGGFFNSCGGSGGSSGSSCGWFDSCGGVGTDASINGRDFACSAFPSLWFCQSNNPVASTPTTPATIVNIQPVPVCDANIKLIDLINTNPTNSTMVVSRYLATCMPSAVPFLPDLKKPIITITSPAQNKQVATATVRVTGYVDDVSSKIKIEGVEVSTLIGANGIYFDTIINVPVDGLINIEAADAAGNLAVPVEVRIVLPLVDKKILSVAYANACTIQIGKLKCLGQNFTGQLGNGATSDSATPVDVLGMDVNVTSISVGDSHSCAIQNSKVKCWGYNTTGQVGTGTTSFRETAPVEVQSMQGATSISAGYDFSCGIINGGVKCWGNNDVGQLGDGTGAVSYVPVQVLGLESNVKKIFSGGLHSCAQLNDDSIRCWGANYHGQLGDGTSSNVRASPVNFIYANNGIKEISLGMNHTCYLDNSGTVNCIGYNYFKQLGNGLTMSSKIPITPNLQSSIEAVYSGSNSTCAKNTVGEFLCWGDNYFQQLAIGTDGSAPAVVNGLVGNFESIKIGNLMSCALSKNNDVFCWGPMVFQTGVPKKIDGF